MADRWYTLHLTFPAFTREAALSLAEALEPLLADDVQILLTREEDWDATETLGGMEP